MLLKPAVAFNPPVRFLQTSGHKDKMGISYDTANLKVKFSKDADKKFKHLLKKLVINPVRGLGATATYESVFADYGTATSTGKGSSSSGGATSSGSGSSSSGPSTSSSGGSSSGGTGSSKSGGLFGYSVTINNGLIKQLMKEAKDINCKKFPAAATFLLRNIVESILRHIIDGQKANKSGGTLDLEGCLNLCASNHVNLPNTDKKYWASLRKIISRF